MPSPDVSDYIRRLFSVGAIPRLSRAVSGRDNNADRDALGSPAYNGRLPRSGLLANWPSAARIQLNWDMLAELHSHDHERGEVRRVCLASEEDDLRRRYINFCEGKHEVPREIPCDRMFAENINDVHFLAACFEYVAFASELPASDARMATISDVLRECQLGAGPYD